MTRLRLALVLASICIASGATAQDAAYCRSVRAHRPGVGLRVTFEPMAQWPATVTPALVRTAFDAISEAYHGGIDPRLPEGPTQSATAIASIVLRPGRASHAGVPDLVADVTLTVENVPHPITRQITLEAAAPSGTDPEAVYVAQGHDLGARIAEGMAPLLCLP